MMNIATRLSAALILLLICTAAVPVSLLSNGDFGQADGKGGFVDWPMVAGASAQTEDAVHFVHLESAEPEKTVLLYREVKLPQPLPAALELRLRVRYAVTPGKNSWFDARVMMLFKDKDGKELKAKPAAPYFRGVSKGWVNKSEFFAVPKRAQTIAIMPCLLQVKQGTLDLAECELFPATAEQLPPPPPMIPSEILGAPVAAPAELHVVGNHLETAAAKTVWLQGLCIDSLEWSAGGEHLPQSIPVATDQWHANVIRLPVSSKMWWGHGGYQKDNGLAYRQLVDACIATAYGHGAYVALDLHRFGLPAPEDVAFWKDAAQRYKNNPALILELFNEPHSMSWKAWRSGGAPDGAGRQAIAENDQESDAPTTTGLQALVEAVRGTGAKNLLIAGGLDWGYDLSGVVAGYALEDKAGADGIMYSSHIYPWKKDWQHNTLDAAAKFPVFVGEVGCPQKWEDFSFIPPGARSEKLGPGCTWPGDVIGMLQKYKINWTGFCFHPKCGPPLILDWTYAPNDFWGIYVKDALGGKHFELERMR